MAKHRCHYCTKPATRLCDYVTAIAATRLTYMRVPGLKNVLRPVPLASLDSPMATCDRPLCHDHAHQQGVSFVCGKGCSRDTIDYCPQHHAYTQVHGDRLPTPTQR